MKVGILPLEEVLRVLQYFQQHICLRGKHNEIHNMQKCSEALPSQVFQVVARSYQGLRAGKVFTLLLDQFTKGTHIRSPKVVA